MNTRFIDYLTAFILILCAAFSRLIPHPANFAPITAIALFSGTYFDKRFAFIVPLAALFISDIFLGFYDGMYVVYGATMLISLLGIWLQNNFKFKNIVLTTLTGSLLFYFITNFFCWLGMPETYERSFQGLVTCYVAAIPFFRNSLAGDIFYLTTLYVTFMLLRKHVLTKVAI
jgi:hypothetical protein